MDALKTLELIEQHRATWQQLPPELQAIFKRLAADCLEDIRARIGTRATNPPPAISAGTITAIADLIQRHWKGTATGTAITMAAQILNKYLGGTL